MLEIIGRYFKKNERNLIGRLVRFKKTGEIIGEITEREGNKLVIDGTKILFKSDIEIM